MQFKVIFHRYFNGQSRFSTPQFIHSDTGFAGAVRIAEAILSGLSGADPDSRYIIASVDTVGLRGDQSDGVFMFETRDELNARLNA